MKRQTDYFQWWIQRGIFGHGSQSSLAIDFDPSNEEINVRYWEIY